MRVTDKLEKMMEKLMDKLGGTFSGGKIQPIEIARKAVQELKRNQKVSVSQTYVPNVYQVLLNLDDFGELTLYKDAIIPEIGEYLTSHIKKENLSLLGELEIELIDQEAMERGKFEIKSLIKKGKKIDAELEKTLVRIHPITSYVWVEIKEGPEAGKSLTLVEGENVIGRKEDNQIKISDPEISRTHSVIYLNQKEACLEDMGSTNGTYLNGKPVTKRTELWDGDLISAGNTVLEFKCQKKGFEK